jgi:hypothetical protein
MARQADVRRIALSLAGTTESRTDFAFGVEIKGKHKGYCWVWKERIHPKKPRVPNQEVLAVRVRDVAEKAALLAGDPDRFFTEPHYDGFPAVLVRLAKVTAAQLRPLLLEAWRCLVPPHLVEGPSTTAGSGSRRAAVRGARRRRRTGPSGR